jgi:hypothetical protein
MTARSNPLRVLAFALPATVAIVCLLAFAGPVAYATGPAGNENIQIPLRWCALRGSPAGMAGPNPGWANPITTNVLVQRRMRANEIWTPGANITFRDPFPEGVPASSANFPVIEDPWPPAPYRADGLSGGPGQPGDILRPVEGDEESFAEYRLARAECEEAWDFMAMRWGVSIEGMIALNIRKFVDPPGTIPFTETHGRGELPTSFSPTGSQCETPPNRVTAVAETFIGLKDFSFVSGSKQPMPGETQTEQEAMDKKLVAHELGHTLSLGHGNGLDDDGDKKYDLFCDPVGENELAPPQTLMHPFTFRSTTTVTTLQRGTSRAIARVTPGSQIDPPFELVNADTLSDRRVDDAQDVKGASLDMTGVGMTINPNQERVILSHTLFGLASKDETTEYAAFLDLDSDQTTGGQPAELGFPTRFKGAELVTRVRAKGSKFKRVHPGQVSQGRPATPKVWRFEGGEFAHVTNSEVTASVSASVAYPEEPHGEELPFPMFDVVSAQMPSDVVGHVGSRVRLQAITAGKGKDWVDVLPGEKVRRRVPAGSADLYMTSPTYPACTTIPEVAQPGDVVTLKAAGFDTPGAEVDVFLDAEPIANEELNRAGKMSTDVAIPKKSSGEPHLITIRVGNSALSAECVAATASTRGAASPAATATALGESGGPPVPLLLTLAATLVLVAFGVIALSVVFRNP